MFAECHENMFGLPSLEESFASAPEINVVWWSSVGVAAANTGGKKCFRPVRGNYCGATPIDKMPRIRISRDDLACRACLSRDLRNHRSGQETFAVIFENDRINIPKILPHSCHDPLNFLVREGDKLLAVDTNDLLLTRYDSRFQNGPKRFVFKYLGNIDFLLR